MKTIIETSTNLSKYVFDDDQNITVNAANITCPDFTIGDMNASNATIVEGVTAPDDWVGDKFTYSDGDWAVNPNYVEPEDPE